MSTNTQKHVTSKDCMERFNLNLNGNKSHLIIEKEDNSYFYSSQYKHFDRYDPTIQDDVIFEQELNSLLTYFTQPLDKEIIQHENETLRMVKQDICIEIQSVLIDIQKKSKQFFFQYCDAISQELQALSFPREYSDMPNPNGEITMLENVALKTEMRTLLSILSMVCLTNKELVNTEKELKTSEDLVNRLDIVRNDYKEENDALKQIKLGDDVEQPK